MATQLPAESFDQPSSSWFGIQRWRSFSSARAGAALIGLLGAVTGCGGAPDREDTDGADVLEGADTKYPVPGTEGLGVAIAIVLDNSGSMKDEAGNDSRPKYEVARRAIEAMLDATDSLAATRPDFPIKITIFTFSSRARRVLAIQPYNRDSVRAALDGIEEPRGGTAIGLAMAAARRELYQGGVFRKYLLVVTDGENTEGRSPETVAREISRRSDRAVQMYFVAFDTGAEKFEFLRSLGGDVLPAGSGASLRATLDTLYRKRIWAEAGGEAEAADSGAVTTQ